MIKPVVLIVMDGWGIAPPGPGNAISLANTPNFNRFWSLYPHTKLIASGEGVGLPRGEDGNTETGHLNLGAGRIVYQDLPRINMAIADGSFYKNPGFIGAINHTRKNNSNIHIIGLVGSGGVHSNLEHLFALLFLFKEQNSNNIFIHVITDGRDSPPTAALEYLDKVTSEIQTIGIGKIASVMGRYYAMDRDRRWDRTEKAYLALTEGIGDEAISVEEAVKQSYANHKTDEFIKPTIIKENNQPVALIKDNDAVIFFNFRIDRPRQLTKAFVLDDFEKEAQRVSFDPYSIKYQKSHLVDTKESYPVFKRKAKLSNLFFVTMTEYEKNLPTEIAFPPQVVDLPIGRVISQKNINQLRVSETEKERFVTYYFNGLKEAPFPGESRLIIPSPKVSTYDLKPEMSAEEMTKALVERINSDIYSLFIINYANVDMVGHTGVISAAVKAVEVVDNCIGLVARTVMAHDGSCIITADHGNAEEMIDATTGGTETEHSTNPVPCIIISNELQGRSKELESGILADVAPTILHLMNIPKPSSMTGRNLLQNM